MNFHRSQVFLLILLAFIAGIFLGSFVTVPQIYVWIGILICTIFIVVFFRRDSKLLNSKVAFGALISMVFIFGFARINVSSLQKHVLKEFAEISMGTGISSNKHGVKVELIGYVDNEPSKGDKTQSLIFKSKKIVAGDLSVATDESVLINTEFFPEYEYGQQIKISGEISLPKNSPDSSFDWEAYLAKDDIFTVMYMPQIKNIDAELSFFERSKIKLLQKIFRFKNCFQKSVNRSIAEPNAAFINGILLGSRSQIPDGLKKSFATTGTTHILAISGFNITIVAGMIASFFLLFFKRRTAFWFSITGVALFTILTGAQSSVVRAAIMGCLLLLANKSGRPYGARNAIVFAGAMMILINPNILRNDVGFQLSFMATLGLIFLCPYFTEKFKKLPGFFNFRENLAMTVSAQIAVLPLLLFYFKQISIVSLPANILVLPLVPFSMALGFISGLAGMILPFLGVLVGYFAWFLTSIQIYLVEFFAKPSWAALSVSFPWYFLILVYAVMLFFAIKKFRVE